jgi:ribosomal protein S12 methylthiotransferase
MERAHAPEGRRFSLENLGCAKNQVDAEVMIRRLLEAGWEYTEDPDRAQLIIVNSCGFIEPAKQESIDTTLDLRDRYPDKKILLAGCLSQRYGSELAGELAEVDGIFGNRDLSAVVETAEAALRGESPVALPAYAEYDERRSTLLSFPGSSYLKISEGCRHRCSFCAIPLIRGGLRSMAREEVLEEARRLIRSGVFEINLIAQDLASYGLDRGEAEFLPLLRELAGIPGDFWIRLLYIHPDSFPGELIPLIRDHPKILPYFDIPFQHASVKVLRAMGRRGNADSYLSLVERIRGALPDAVLRTTLLVGFYGEGEREFEELLQFQQSAQFDWAGSFTYSPEDETAALTYEGRPDYGREPDAAAQRERRLRDLQQSISEGRMERFAGRTLRVLVEERVEQEELLLGRAYLQAPEVDGAVVIHPAAGQLPEAGRTVTCRILRRNNIDLEAVVTNG